MISELFFGHIFDFMGKYRGGLISDVFESVLLDVLLKFSVDGQALCAAKPDNSEVPGRIFEGLMDAVLASEDLFL